MLRKITAICLVCLILIGLFPTVAFSAETYNGAFYDMTEKVPGGLLYFNSETQSVVGGSVSGDLVIPEQIRGIPVLSIGALAFQSDLGITSVELPEGLTVIENGAFNLCKKLASVTLPSTLERIEGYALRYTLLEQIEIPESLRFIGEEAFAYTRIGSLSLHSVPLFLGARAFSDCRYFSEVLIPETVTLSEGVFRNCGGLKKVILPDTLTELPPSLFSGCINLCEIDLPSNLEAIGDHCFYDCERLSSIDFPSTLRTIGNNSFSDCRLLASVTLPDSVTYIGDEAFQDCPIQSLVFPKNLEQLGYCAFYGTDLPFAYKLSGTYLGDWLVSRPVGVDPNSIVVEEGTIGIAKGAIYVYPGDYSKDTASITLPSTVKYIYADSFLGLSDKNHVSSVSVHPDNPYLCVVDNILYSKDLTTLIFCGNYIYNPSIELPRQLRRIGDKAFYNCETLTSITLPDSVEEIGDYALSNFYLESVVLSKNLRTIGDYAFTGYNSLRSLVIPGKVETIGDYAFSGNVNLYAVAFGKNIRTIGDHAFASAPLQQVVLGDKVESIGEFAFFGGNLRYVHLGAGIKTIGTQAFAQNLNLTDIVFPATLEELGDKAFYQCEGLERAIFHDAAPKVGDRVFCYDHLIPGENGSLSSIRVEFLPKLSVYYSNPEGWSSMNSFYAKYWADAPKQVYLDVPKGSWFAEAVDYASGNSLMNGVGNGRFSPDSTMTRAMVVTVLWRLQGSPSAEKTHNFTDIAPASWYAEAVNWAFAQGIATGVSDTLFNPDGSITREQLATLLYRYAVSCDTEPVTQGTLPEFPDKGTTSAYATEALAWACTEGLINGVKESGITYLRPKASATRAQVAAILMRYIERPGE